MPSIFVISTQTAGWTHGARLVSYLSAGGNTVDTTLMTASQPGSLAGYDTAWGSGHDLIVADHTITDGSRGAEWVEGKWGDGVPVLLSGSSLYPVTLTLGMGGGSRYDPSPNTVDLVIPGGVASHPIVTGLTSPYNIQTNDNYIYALGALSPVNYGTTLGTASCAGSGNGSRHLVAFDTGDAVSGGTAPARGVFFGSLDFSYGVLASGGQTIITRAIDWLVAGGAPSGITATLNATAPAPVVSLAATVEQPATTATLNAVAPLPVVSLLATVATGTPVEATLSAVAPLPVVSLAATVEAPAGDVTATLNATAPLPVVSLGAVVNGGDLSDHVVFKAAARIGYLTIPTAQPPPAGIDPVPVVRLSHVAPPPTEANPIITEGVDYPWTSPVEVGTPHVFVGGVDVTYLGGAPIQNVRRSATSPAGDVAATFELPAMQAWDKPGEGAYAMLRPDAPVDVALIHPDDSRAHLWSGFLSADAAEVARDKRAGFTADGTLWQAGYSLHEPPHYLPLTDIGVLIPRALNSVPNKRWSDIPEVTTGILSRDRGASNQSVMQYVVDLLGKAWTADGRQWTLVEVAPREFRLQLKAEMDTADATVTYGAKGIEVNLSREQSTRVDVIYGKGVTAAGGQWRGTRFPGLILATPPAYPNTDASSMHVGDTDADTDSGTGISDFQRRLVELGYSLRVDGIYNTNDADVVRRLQSRMGLLVDGVVGPQTWSGIFNRGPADIDLTQWREPIAAQPWALEHLRDPNGVILGPNPAHDDAWIVHAIEVDFGTNITWQQAQPIAERMLAVESEPALTGTIRLRTDPHEVWRGVIKPGWRVKVLGFQGEDVIVRVAAVDVDTDRDGMVVTLTVDEQARDAMSVAAVLERNRAALPDPARKPGNPQRDSRITRDRYVQWDIDSPCGFFPRTAVFGGLWVAPNPIPFSEVGRFVKAVFTSTVPFALMLFGLPVKPSQVNAIVGNPLATTDPYRPHTEALSRLGWIEAWGEQGQRMGYWPGDEGSGYAFSSKTELIGSVDYVSGYGVWVWPLIYSNTTGFVGGGSGDWISRFYPATDN